MNDRSTTFLRTMSIFMLVVILISAAGGTMAMSILPLNGSNNLADINVPHAVGSTELVSRSSDGTLGNSHTANPSISADGRFVAFDSYSDNLVSEDTNNAYDVFVKDRLTGAIQRVSVASDGSQTPDSHSSESPAITGDGRYIAFESNADNLVSGDTNGPNYQDIFVHDRVTEQTVRVSISSDGAQSFGASYDPDISDDGQRIVFVSNGSELVSGDTNDNPDIFVHDRSTGETIRVSISSAGVQTNASSSSPVISDDGRYVAFYSHADNLIIGDTNGSTDIFVHDLQTGVTERVSVSDTGEQADHMSLWPSISADGRYLAFSSWATNMLSTDFELNYYPPPPSPEVDIYVHDRLTGNVQRVSINSSGEKSNGASYRPSISGDGRYVAFVSHATDLVAEDSNGHDQDIFVHDRFLQENALISIASDGTQANHNGYYMAPDISTNGGFIAFQSNADNLVDDDDNEQPDIFVHKYLSSISGQITYRDGSANSGVTISAGNGLSTSTDSNGQYSFDLLPPGEYTLTPSKTNHSFSPPTIDITVPSDASGVDFTGGLTISGTLSYGDGSPIDGVNIYKDTELMDTTDGSGQYALEYLPPGTFTITPSRSGYQFSPNSQDITLPPNASGIDFTGGLSISGTARHGDLSPIAGLTINAGPSLDTTTNSSGNYVFEFLAPGTYTLTPSKADYSFSPPTRELTLPPSASEIDFQGGLTISGNVTDSEESPIADVSLSNGIGDVETTDSSGEYQFDLLPPGSYTVTPTKANYLFSPVNQHVSLPPNAVDTNFIGTQLCIISGSVKDVEGKPIPGVNISDGAGNFSQTNEQGEFQLNNLLPGTYHVEPTKAGYAFTPDTLEVIVPPDAADLEYIGRIAFQPVFLPMICK